MAQPVFLSLDGLDGTGKTTQCRLLVEWLTAQKVPVTACTDPGGTALGLELRHLLLHRHEHRMAVATEALLFMASRAQLVEEVIRPALSSGEVVVSDRFTLANVVYQGHAGGLKPDDLWAAGRVATGGLEPDLTLVFDLPVEVARARRNRDADRMEDRDAEYQRRVRTGFAYEVGMRPDRIRRIDAAPGTDVVHRAVRREVARLLTKNGWIVSDPE